MAGPDGADQALAIHRLVHGAADRHVAHHGLIHLEAHEEVPEVVALLGDGDRGHAADGVPEGFGDVIRQIRLIGLQGGHAGRVRREVVRGANPGSGRRDRGLLPR